MTEEIYRWPRNAIRGDFLRGGIGFAASLLFFILVGGVTSPIGILLGLLAVVFGLFLDQAFLRANTAIKLLPEGLAVAGFFGTTLVRWDALDLFVLRYYTLRRDKQAGWLDLKLGSGSAKITIDDRFDGFRPILERAWQAARVRDIGISSSTYANLTAAGLLQKSSV